jgi:hypothetical protein
MWNTVPAPSRDSSVMRPPSTCSTARRLENSPSPDPPAPRRVVKKGVKALVTAS